MADQRTYKIEVESLEPENLRLVIHSRAYRPPAGILSLDTVIAAIAVFAVVSIGWLLWPKGDVPAPPFLMVVMGGIAAVVVGPMLSGVVRKIRQKLGRRQQFELFLAPGSHRDQPQLRYGRESIPTGSIEAVALLGWQEQTAEDRIWDVMVVGPEVNLEVVSGYAREPLARDLATALAQALNVELRESSVVGGSTTSGQQPPGDPMRTVGFTPKYPE